MPGCGTQCSFRPRAKDIAREPSLFWEAKFGGGRLVRLRRHREKKISARRAILGGWMKSEDHLADPTLRAGSKGAARAAGDLKPDAAALRRAPVMMSRRTVSKPVPEEPLGHQMRTHTRGGANGGREAGSRHFRGNFRLLETQSHQRLRPNPPPPPPPSTEAKKKNAGSCPFFRVL